MAHLRQDFKDHVKEDAKNFKYSHHMAEDLIVRLSDAKLASSEKNTQVQIILADITARLKMIERIIWFGLLGIIGVFGTQLSILIFK